jgi:hypothetical protein
MPVDVLDIASHAFARRFANLLAARRRDEGWRLGELARSSEGRFTVRELKAAELGALELTDDVVGDLATLYGTDLGTILPVRLPLVIDRGGVIATGGVEARFDPSDETSLLDAYLRLIRALRSQQREPMIDLRRNDVEALAIYLGDSGDSMVERLGALMGATRGQRSSMSKMFVAGALVIGLATSTPATTRFVAAAGEPTHRLAPVMRLIPGDMSTSMGIEPTRYVRRPIYVSPVIVGSDAWRRLNEPSPV